MTAPVSQENYGKKFDYDAQWAGPLNIERKRTDFPFIISFGIYLVLWIGIAIYAFNMGNLGMMINTGDVGIINDHDLTSSPHSNDRHFFFAIKYIIFRFILLSIFLSLTYIISLRWFARIIIYTAIFFFCGLLIGLICLFSYLYATNTKNSYVYILPLIILIIAFVVTVIIFIAFRKKIKIACAVIKESSKVVIFFPFSLLFPILPYILYAITVIFCASITIYLSVLPKNEYNETPSYIYFFHFINIFGFLWMTCFITAFSQMILSGSYATWYWFMNKKYVPSYTIISFMAITTRYHLGTLAFGSLIITICNFIKIILYSISSRLRGNCNPLAYLVFGWYRYLFGNIEQLLQYINCNAYIMSCIHGTKYLESAKNAFNLLMRNIINVLVINKVTEAILVLGQFIIITISALATYGYCHYLGIPDTIQFTAILLIVLSTLAITYSFFMVLRIAINTVFLCVLEDFERNDGTTDRPYFMSIELKTLLLQNS
ncbi:choline transporter-like 2 [Phymastichus coffea]|uniref:choline transporter-like 2 n=1 Tax=Phymastichus coffea TaxID=108790 RepID=UPI00273C2318|nr:choline transporter-like 2 [Phymastichus coffea]